MSIASLLSEVTPRSGGLLADWWLLVLLAASFAAAVLAGAMPPRKVSGPDRIPSGRPAWLLLGVMFGALGVYLFTTSVYLSLKYPSPAGLAATTQPHELTAEDNAFASTVPPLLGFLALLAGDAAVRDMTRQDLGIAPRRASRGIVWGLIGVVIVVPPLFLLEEIVEAVYRRVHYTHPTEHPLLHLLREKPSPAVVAAIVIGACVIAPLFEELLFRGHLQTLLRRMFYRLGTRRDPAAPPSFPRGFPVITGQPVETELPADDPPAPSPPPTAAQTWAAIILTSLVFALVHPAWSMPVIFVLALCLGYAYERTGNLWVSITIHAGFNTISTVIFLTSLYGR
ncbi:MAG TPA: CPBP family intramembrane glutamic endopeptidase [Tepidisphaeraceae bacterium]|jgi:membrane protease YdiL (CAAX protease family)